MTPARRKRDKRAQPSDALDEPAGIEPAATLPRRRTVLIDLALMIGAFAVASAVAEIAGAANLGTAMSFGQIAFALAAFYVFMRS